jgi:hypothetical protein
MMERAFRWYPTNLKTGRVPVRKRRTQSVAALAAESPGGLDEVTIYQGHPVSGYNPRHPPLITMENPQ